MNERLEAFRNRLRGPERKEINWQFWVGSPTAWLALFLSSTTAFYTFLYHSDQLSVVVDSPTIRPDGNTFRISPPAGMTLINSGSRPVVVTGAQLLLVQGHPHNVECDDDRDRRTEIPLVFEQTVVRPYDATSKTLKFSKEEETFEAVLGNRDRGTGQASVLVCVRFELAATDAARWRKTVSAGLQLGWPREPHRELQRARFETRPKYLMKRNRFWTEVDRDKFL